MWYWGQTIQNCKNRYCKGIPSQEHFFFCFLETTCFCSWEVGWEVARAHLKLHCSQNERVLTVMPSSGFCYYTSSFGCRTRTVWEVCCAPSGLYASVKKCCFLKTSFPDVFWDLFARKQTWLVTNVHFTILDGLSPIPHSEYQVKWPDSWILHML